MASPEKLNSQMGSNSMEHDVLATAPKTGSFQQLIQLFIYSSFV